MLQNERRLYLINYLISENSSLKDIGIPEDDYAQRKLLRSLINIRTPKAISNEFITVQDEYLQEELAHKSIVNPCGLTPILPGIYLWQGDITALAADAVVNAANSALLGCFVPCHGCIDNAIHSAAGVQLRLECSRIMEIQQTAEPTGRAKITKAYNLPCNYILHTVGPIIHGKVTESDCSLLSDCYRHCLELASAYGLKNIAFCCISTGEFHFPNEKAAKIAIQAVNEFLSKNPNSPEVIFNVFKDIDYEIYRRLLQGN